MDRPLQSEHAVKEYNDSYGKQMRFRREASQ